MRSVQQMADWRCMCRHERSSATKIPHHYDSQYPYYQHVIDFITYIPSLHETGGLPRRWTMTMEMEVMEMRHRDGDVMWANEMADGAEETLCEESYRQYVVPRQ